MQAGFLWGTPDDIGPLAAADVPLFRLTNAAGGLPPVALPFAVPSGGRARCRQGRVVGRVWETPEAQFCFLAGVQPPDLAAARGEQAVAVFPEMENLLAEVGMTFAHVVRTWIYLDRVCEWSGAFNAARTAFLATLAQAPYATTTISASSVIKHSACC